MSLQGREITEREKAAIYYHIFSGVDDWKQIYKIADAATDGNAEIKSLDIYISRWKNSTKVKRCIEEVRQKFSTRLAEERIKGREDILNNPGESEGIQDVKPTTTAKRIDYSDPKNRQKLYNEVIANAKDDPKTQLDAAKMFEQIQKDDREAAKAQKQSRVYLPLRCESCPLYDKARKKTTK